MEIMATLDTGMIYQMFEERNNRKPMATERGTIRQMLISTAFLAGKDDFERAYLNYIHPPVAESDVDWVAVGADMSKWGMI